eukprot:3926113-Rhodomonas_salina.1
MQNVKPVCGFAHTVCGCAHTVCGFAHTVCGCAHTVWASRVPPRLRERAPPSPHSACTSRFTLLPPPPYSYFLLPSPPPPSNPRQHLTASVHKRTTKLASVLVFAGCYTPPPNYFFIQPASPPNVCALCYAVTCSPGPRDPLCRSRDATWGGHVMSCHVMSCHVLTCGSCASCAPSASPASACTEEEKEKKEGEKEGKKK